MDNVIRSARQRPQKAAMSPAIQDTNYESLVNLMQSSRSNTKFIIRYQQKQVTAKSGHKINRYSSKYEHQIVRQKRISQAFLQKNKFKSKDGSSLPSYLRPTQSSISAQLQRNRIASLADMNHHQNKNGAIIRLRSKSLEEQQQENDRQYNRIPIEFYDQKCNGCGADSIRARIVFRGYAPKNTYYYLKTLKPYKRKQKKVNILQAQSSCSITQQVGNQNKIPTSISTSNTGKNEFDIRFQSKFESGNLSAASRVSIQEYWLYMREDTNTHGLRQWYYFVATNRKPIKAKFRIYKFSKSYSLYRLGMKPYIRTAINDSIVDWHQGGEKVKYEFDSIQKCYYVEFQYKFLQQNQEVQFAMLPPYTYSMLKDYMRCIPLQNLPQTQQNASLQHNSQFHAKSEGNDKSSFNFESKSDQKIKVQISVIGQSLAGLDIHLIQIKKKISRNQPVKSRQAIVILGRTHPGQTVSNFSIEAFIDTILGSEQFTQFYDYFIVPMINPDGVYFGNHRTSIIGQDLNRNFNTNDFEIFPEIQAVHNALNKARNRHKIRFLIDLHGHSARKNIFAYGDEHEMNTAQYLHTRILPKLLNDCISSFKYDYCIFRQSRQKKNTARVYYTNKFKINCLTIQQSYGLLEQGPIGIKTWKNFGIALANCLVQFAKLYQNGKQKILEQYLFAEIEKEKIQLEKRMQKHKKMLGIPNEQQAFLEAVKIKQTQNALLAHNNQRTQILNQQKISEVKADQNYSDSQRQKQYSQKNKHAQLSESKQSISSSQLSSGDQGLQNKNQQIEIIKKEIYKVGCMKQGIRRQLFNVADKRLRLFEQAGQEDDLQGFRRMHEQKSSMIPRIAKLQLKRKQQYNLSFKREFREDRRDILQKQRQDRRKQIEAKFKKMQLPSIRK